jgi:hypothetical protein
MLFIANDSNSASLSQEPSEEHGCADDRMCATELHTQFLWALYQAKVKKAMHARSRRVASAPTVANATQGQLAAQQALLRTNPSFGPQMTAAESFTGAVPKTLKGSKRYWRAAFVQLMAMCIEFGAPEYFLTLTANEMGWVDSRRACDGAAHGERPVEATRHYHHRWSTFKANYLSGVTPIGEIVRIWYRQEEQGRGSLHVHAAIWVKLGTATPEAIVAMAPRGPDFNASAEPGTPATDPEAGMTRAECEWRRFILSVQRHDCRDGCRWKVAGSTANACPRASARAATRAASGAPRS